MIAPATCVIEPFRPALGCIVICAGAADRAYRRFRLCQLEVSGLLVQNRQYSRSGRPAVSCLPSHKTRHFGIVGLHRHFWRWSTLAILWVGLSGEAFLPPSACGNYPTLIAARSRRYHRPTRDYSLSELALLPTLPSFRSRRNSPVLPSSSFIAAR
jgi:hypothetical protein